MTSFLFFLLSAEAAINEYLSFATRGRGVRLRSQNEGSGSCLFLPDFPYLVWLVASWKKLVLSARAGAQRVLPFFSCVSGYDVE